MYCSEVRGNVCRIRMGDARVLEEGQIEAIWDSCKDEGGLWVHGWEGIRAPMLPDPLTDLVERPLV